jgi:LmbE family N-acetylglucosaminyl deacetylase
MPRRPEPLDLPPALARVLCVAAHPDDNEFVIAGSVARWAREGRHVAFCLVTTGGAGVNEHTPSSDGLIPVRERESREAARLLGVAEVVFLGYQDGVLEPTLALRRDLTRVIRRQRPDVVVCADPTVRWYGSEYLNHPDHRAAASAALDAVFPSAETSAIFPELLTEGLAPHKVKQVLVAGALAPDVVVDIAATFDTKVAALRAHASQVGKGDWVEPLLRGWAERDGQAAGLTLGEAFKRLVLS